MGSLENRLRSKWQDYSGNKAAIAEKSFYEVFEDLFSDTELQLIRHPQKFRNLYLQVELDDTELNEIYIPDKDITRHGIMPDAVIRNIRTSKEIYVEIKRQDGWVENKRRKDGRGNAHERLCKYFTPGLLRHLRKEGNITEPHLLFWIILQGDITRDICRVKEIRFWFDGNKNNVIFWRDTKDAAPIIEHFFRYILPLLE